MEDKNFHGAIKVFEEILNYQPNMTFVKVLLGEAYLSNGNTGKAVSIFEELTDKEPQNAGFSGHLANAYLARNWHLKAIKAFKNAISLDKDNLFLWLGLSQAYTRARKYKKAREILIKALKKDKEKQWNEAGIYLAMIQIDFLGNMFETIKEDIENLFKHIDEVEELKEQITFMLITSAQTMVEREYYEESKIIVDAVLNIDPNNKELKKFQKLAIKMIEIEDELEDIYYDDNIDELLTDLLEFEFMLENFMDDERLKARRDMRISTEMDIIEGINIYRKSILYLKQKYPKIYEFRKEFFDDILDPKKINKIKREHKKEMRRIEKNINYYLKYFSNQTDDIDEFDELDFDRDYVPNVYNEPYVREQPKIGRNDPCPCGSGKKYKYCCGR